MFFCSFDIKRGAPTFGPPLFSLNKHYLVGNIHARFGAMLVSDAILFIIIERLGKHQALWCHSRVNPWVWLVCERGCPHFCLWIHELNPACKLANFHVVDSKEIVHASSFSIQALLLCTYIIPFFM